MQTTDKMLGVALAVVEEAEAMFTAGLGADPTEMKNPGDFATIIDLEIESAVRRMLTERTDIPVYGEEGGGEFSAAATWVIDPIDGTANYAAGNPMCSILLTLIEDGEPVISVTSLPLLRRRLTAVKGQGIRVNGRAVPTIKDRPLLVTQVGFSSIAAQHNSQFSGEVRLRLLGALARGPLRPRITGSVGVDLALTAQGVFDGAISFSPYVWDNSSGVGLVRAAGGVVTALDGSEWTPHSTGVVAGTPSAHAELMSTIGSILQ